METILIVDDEEINRELLSSVFSDQYNTIQAENGEVALELLESDKSISAVLLDIIMPVMDGIDVLRMMSRNGLLKRVPVFMITAEDSGEKLIECYELGAVDVINKPFMSLFLKARVNNVIELYRHRNSLEALVDEQVRKLQRINRDTVEMLATVVEFRDCESGEHVKRISGLTEILMTKLGELYPEYKMPRSEIEKIMYASVLHDVGKIAIPDNILNKPGKLTNEEFEIMKTHTVKGGAILQNIPSLLDDDLFRYSYDIARHHHERWNGRGYPDGLKGDEISIWAQVVSVADVFDALTSPRVYKAAYSVDKSVQMITGGECGEFNPKLMEAFGASLDDIIKSRVTERPSMPAMQT